MVLKCSHWRSGRSKKEEFKVFLRNIRGIGSSEKEELYNKREVQLQAEVIAKREIKCAEMVWVCGKY